MSSHGLVNNLGATLEELQDTPITGSANHATAVAFKGFSIRENAGTPAVATVEFRRGPLVGGDLLVTHELSADGSGTIVFGAYHDTPDGVYVNILTGSIEGTLYY